MPSTQRYFFCPRPTCQKHNPESLPDTLWFRKAGCHSTKAFGSVQRYQCRSCGKTFSDQTFKLNYWLKKKTDFKAFAKAVGSSTSGCFTARNLHLSYDSFQNRFERLARNGIFLHARVMKGIQLDENLVADGLESYTQSKYFPNNIQILVGENTRFIYDLNLCHFKRKGKMTEKQEEKAKREYADKSFRRKDMDLMFGRILDTTSTLLSRSNRHSVILHTDENQAYRRCVSEHPDLSENQRFQHQRTNSRAARISSNPLAPVNYIDRLVRKDLPNHRRKTVCAAKDDRNMMLRMSWYQASHNYWKANRVKSRAKQTEDRHSRKIWLRKLDLPGGLDSFFENRYLLSHGRSFMTQSATEIWQKNCHSPLHEVSGRIAAHVQL